ASVDAMVDAVADVSVAGDLTSCKLHSVYSSSNADCNTCAEQKCCAEVNGCFDNTDCNDNYVNCILACVLIAPPDGGAPDGGVPVCLTDCAAQYPSGKA